MDQHESDLITVTIKEMARKIAPDLRYVAKYGGELFLRDPENDNNFVGGIFAYKAHISLEFSQGASFDDPAGQLEGKGKNRRHLKFRTLADVTGKNTRGFLKQALEG